MIEWAGGNKEKKVFIFYHRVDFDGKMSAMIVANKEDGRKFFCGSNYYDEFDFSEISEGDKVYIVDFTFDKTNFEKLLSKTKNIVWLDHHKVNYEEIYNSLPETKDLNGYRNDKFSGCELTWLWFNKGISLEKFIEFDLFEMDLPKIIYLLGRYDIWDKKRKEFETDIKDFQFGLRLRNTNMNTQEGIDEMFSIYRNIGSNTFVRETIQIGNNIRNYEKQKIVPRMKLLSNVVSFEGLKACAINTFETSSDAFGDEINNYDVCITYFYIPKDKNWDVHLYSANPIVHVGKICQKFGGGGHPGAGGCRMSFDQIKSYFLT